MSTSNTSVPGRAPNRSTGGPRRRPTGNRRRPGGTSQSSARVPQPSALDLALDAAAATPQPTPPSFRGFGLAEALVVTIERRGITVPSPIQARTLPDALAGRDILGRAQTGSGKTLAFGIPLLATLAAGPKARPNKPLGLILVPTRELAEQVKDALAPLAHTLNRSVTAVYGGASIARQVDALNRGSDVVVATPGRLEDLIARRSCSLAEITITVLDEADFMADLGFMPAVTRILDQVRPGTQRMLFSATLDRGVDALITKYLVDPAVHAVASPAARIDSMDHLTFEVDTDNKADVAAEVATRQGRTLFFVRTKHGADRLAKRLTRGGLSAGAIHGNLSQSQRQRALDAFAAGRVPVLVATDVAARGIHVDAVDLVVHYDPPADHKDYLHRSGRTARAGARGTVLSLVLPSERSGIAAIHRRLDTGTTAVVVDPRHAAVRELASSGTPVVITAEPVREPERPERPRYGRGGQSGGAGRPRRTGAPSGSGRTGAPTGSGRHPRAGGR